MSQTDNTTYFIGMMSGTSLDGIDVALISSNQHHFAVAETYFLAYPAALKQTLIKLHTPSDNELEVAQITANAITKLYADAVNALLEKAQRTPKDIAAIGCHGQTIRHRPELGFTVQIVNSALLAELTNMTVVSDFRSRDIAAGGQGAPLVPAFHQGVFADKEKNRAIINIGGIANITYLPSNGDILGFDSGPGNMLLDYWAQLKIDKAYDKNGEWAATGVVHESFLSNMLAEPYFALPPPKSTGRDLFNADWLEQHILYPHCKAEDIARTLVSLTVDSISQAALKHCADMDEVYVCGGGAHNQLIMKLLDEALGNIPVLTTASLNIDADWVEAAAFAWVAKQTLSHQPSNLPSATGANGTRILGAIYPH